MRVIDALVAMGLTSFNVETDEQGSRATVRCDNGWTVSLTCALGSYSTAGRGFTDDIDTRLESPDCEVAIFDAEDNWFVPKHQIDRLGEYAPSTWVWGFVAAENLAAVARAVADADALIGSGGCPCPDCVIVTKEVQSAG